MILPMDRFARYSWTTLALTLVVILWGAVVRATGSGAGCGSHWPLCNGEVLPLAPRIETMIELTHRLTSGLVGILALGLVVMAWCTRPRGDASRPAAAISLFFMITEGAVGAGLVLFELVADNKSMARALFMGTHLVNTFFLVAALTLTAHFASGGAPFRWRGQGKTGAAVLLGLAALTIAGVSGAIAALGDTLFPARTLAESLAQDLSSTSHILIRLRVLHPILAVASGILVALLALRALKGEPGPAVARPARWTLKLVFLQILAGVVNVMLLAPVWMQLVHLLLADLLWISTVLLGAGVLAQRGNAVETVRGDLGPALEARP